MKTSLKYILIVVLTSMVVLSCSRKKNSFINRNYHAVTAEYNALYNGYSALEEGKKSLNDAYNDNYWEILPIERMQIQEEIMLPGQSKNESFNRAEEKAVKAIQKHSMNIQDKEKNPQIDEAYLLLGKSRYFDQRFVPALEAFNYILYKYPASDKINQAKIWREKTNIRLDNDELAIKNLKRLLEKEDIIGQDLADATAILSQAFLNIKLVDSAITHLETASSATKNHDERGRYRFIQGQLYNSLGYKDSANMTFDKVIELNRKTPRIYLISAHLEKIKNFDYENGDKLACLELLTNLEENRENRPYLDKIYHQIGEYHRNNNSEYLAVHYYNQSLRTDSRDKELRARNYQILGDLNFDNSEYKIAGAYFDSTMANFKINSKPYRLIKRKRDNLEDVIYYEDVVQVNDSILTLVNLPEADRIAYFESFIETLKAKAEEEKQQAEVAARNNGLITGNNTIGNTNPMTPRGGLPNQESVFYFYNPTTVAFGKNEFVKIWGNRKLEDNWRWSSRGNSNINNSVINNEILADASEDELFDSAFYISKIPTDTKVIDSLGKELNFANYQLGLIYKEKFKEYTLAKNKFQTVLKSNPEERLVLPSKYNLYKIYALLGHNDEAAIAKDDIVSNFPNSRYAVILNNPELASLKDENSPESVYENIFELQEKQEYVEVISKCETYINAFEGEPIVPKLELLKASAIGRLYGYEPYSKAINYVAITFANTPEGQQAQEIETKILPRIHNSEFITDSISTNYKVVFKFDDSETSEIKTFKDTLNSVLKTVKYYDLSSSIDVYSPKTTLVLVHGIKNKVVANTFDQLLSKEVKKKINKPYFVISSPNYQIVQIHKNLEVYLSLNNN